MPFSRGSKRVRSILDKAIHKAIRPAFEPLESRTMMTTVVGGSTFQFVGPRETDGNSADHLYNVTVGGTNTVVEFIGTFLDELEVPEAINIPGTVNGVGVNGGLAGREGTQFLSNINQQGTGSATTNVGALATHPNDGTGNGNILYGVNVVNQKAQDGGIILSVQLIRFANSNDPGQTPGGGTIIADLAPAILGPGSLFDGTEDAPPTIDAAVGADFDPISGLLYFVIRGGESDVCQMFTVDVDSVDIVGSVDPINGLFGGEYDDEDDEEEDSALIGSIVFDQTSPTEATLWAFRNFNGEGQLVQVSTANTNNIGSVSDINQHDDSNVNNITGLALQGDDPTVADQYIYATTSGSSTDDNNNGGGTTSTNSITLSGPRLLRILLNPTNAGDRGEATTIAYLPSATNAAIGNNVQALTWSPVLLDTLTGLPGTFVGADSGTDDLVTISTVIRPPSVNLMNIYVSEGDQDSYVTVVADTIAYPHTGPANFDPFASSSGEIQTVVRDDENAAPAGTGVAYLGTRVNTTPILTATIGTASLGVYPADRTEVKAGFETAGDFGKFLFGGTVTGSIIIGGSIDTIYAGWLITGDASGGGAGDPDNIVSGGDIRNIWVQSSAGTGGSVRTANLAYTTGLSMNVGGRMQQFKVLGEAAGNFGVSNTSDSPGFTTPVDELEERGVTGFLGGILQGPDINNPVESFYNDTFTTPQYLGVINDEEINDSRENPAIRVNGTVVNTTTVNDVRDYYAIGLTAGQQIAVQVVDQFGGILRLGIFDPDGRLIATDYSNVDQASTANQAIYFTADKPGIYRLAVAVSGDTTFSTDVGYVGPVPYQLTVNSRNNTNIGNYGFGGLVAGSTIAGSVSVANGHLGAIYSDGSLPDEQLGTLDVTVSNGDLKSVDAASADIFLYSLSMTVGNDVGLIRTRTGGLGLLTNTPVGGDIQVIDAATALVTEVSSNQAIGTIRATSYSSTHGTAGAVDLTANADNQGLDGKIDLIDVTDLVGVSIRTNEGGDIGYINATNIVRDSFFGGGTPEDTIYDPGQAVTFTDDGGANVTISPIGDLVDNPLFDPDNPVPDVFAQTGPQLTVLAYPIRDGGLVLIDVSVTGTVAGTTGYTITTDSTANNAVVGIARLNLPGTGTAPVADPTTGLLTVPQPSTVNGVTTNPAINLNLAGATAINILQLTATGTLTTLTQNTIGEILNIDAANIGTYISRSAIGLNSYRNTAAAVQERRVRTNVFPFLQQHNSINVSGAIVSLRSDRGVGNIVAGSIQSIVANADGSDDASQFEGVNAPIVSNGTINSLDIGEGVLPSGTGSFSRSGIFAGGVISRIFSSQAFADIRGNIVSLSGIELIELNNGSIINSDILVASAYNTASELTAGGLLPNTGTSQGTVVFEIEQIRLTGSGGILGTLIAAADTGRIDVAGFGILNSVFGVVGAGQLGDVTVGGYGIRDTVFQLGTSINSLNATSDATLIPVTNYAPSLRQSATEQFDPAFGFAPNRLTDLHAYFMTSEAAPTIPNVTDGGVIEDVHASGNRTLGSVRARQIRTDQRNNIPVGGEDFPMQFAFGNSIGSIVTRGIINGLEITTGRLGAFRPGGDVSGTGITISGPINNMTINGNFGRIITDPETGDETVDSFIRARGPNGRIGRLTINGNLIGNVSATSKIGAIIVNGSISGNINVDGQSTPKQVLDLLRFTGGLSGGSLTVTGSVGTIEALGSFGADGDSLTITGNLKTLKVGTDRRTNGSVMASDLNVSGTIGAITVVGTVTGTITAGAAIRSIVVTAEPGFDSTQPLVTGAITAGTTIGQIILIGGSLAAPITANFNISKIRVINGNINDVGDITSTNGNVFVVDVRRSNRTATGLANSAGSIAAANGQKMSVFVQGNLTGSVNAGNANGVSIYALGNIGDDTNAQTYSANQFKLIRAGGVITGGTTFTASSLINAVLAGSIGGSNLSTIFTAPTFNTVRAIGDITGNTAITASGGMIRNLIAANIGDADTTNGTLPVNITADTFSAVRIGGVARAGTSINARVINSLVITGTPVSVDTGASIVASETIRRRRIAGAINGTVSPTV